MAFLAVTGRRFDFGPVAAPGLRHGAASSPTKFRPPAIAPSSRDAVWCVAARSDRIDMNIAPLAAAANRSAGGPSRRPPVRPASPRPPRRAPGCRHRPTAAVARPRGVRSRLPTLRVTLGRQSMSLASETSRSSPSENSCSVQSDRQGNHPMIAIVQYGTTKSNPPAATGERRGRGAQGSSSAHRACSAVCSCSGC